MKASSACSSASPVMRPASSLCSSSTSSCTERSASSLRRWRCSRRARSLSGLSPLRVLHLRERAPQHSVRLGLVLVQHLGVLVEEPPDGVGLVLLEALALEAHLVAVLVVRALQRLLDQDPRLLLVLRQHKPVLVEEPLDLVLAARLEFREAHSREKPV